MPVLPPIIRVRLQGWYSAEELVGLLEQNIPTAHGKLIEEPMDYLGLRDYQEKAVHQIEAAIDNGQTRLLVAMATGTGKTRLAIGLIYRLIKSGRFRRILFVVDRTALGEQAGDKFKETRLEELKTFDQIYDLKEVDKIDIEPTTKVNIATVQGLMHAVMYPSENAKVPASANTIASLWTRPIAATPWTANWVKTNSPTVIRMTT